MSKKYRKIASLTAVLVLIVVCLASASTTSGRFKAGHIAIDEEGSSAVNQPTYNLYPGFVLSIEDFRLRTGNGTLITADIKNLLLNNRNLRVGVTKGNRYGITVTNRQARRAYGDGGGEFIRRRHTGAELWVSPARSVRIFGGFEKTGRKGKSTSLLGSIATPTVETDYDHLAFHGGVRFSNEGRYLQFDYRGSSFSDDVDNINDRMSDRYRVNAVAAVPGLETLTLNGGFQHFVYRINNLGDTLTANTVWGGARFSYRSGFALKYNFIWDRSRRTGDLAATDNITHAVFATKRWVGRGALTAGYRFGSRDGVPDEIATTGYFADGWVRPVPEITVKAGYGSQKREVQEGTTLTGDRDYTRYRGSVTYQLPQKLGFIRASAQSRKVEDDDIGSSAEFIRSAVDGSIRLEDYFELSVAYSYQEGEYENSGGTYIFSDHLISGDIRSVEYRKARLGLGGTYVRSRQNVDIESSQLRFSAQYVFMPEHLFEIKYTVHNFDNLADTSPIYSEYYTANIVEVTVSHEF